MTVNFFSFVQPAVLLGLVTLSVIRAREPGGGPTPWATASENLVTQRSTAPKNFSSRNNPFALRASQARSPICTRTEASSVTSVPRNMRESDGREGRRAGTAGSDGGDHRQPACWWQCGRGGGAVRRVTQERPLGTHAEGPAATFRPLDMSGQGSAAQDRWRPPTGAGCWRGPLDRVLGYPTGCGGPTILSKAH